MKSTPIWRITDTNFSARRDATFSQAFRDTDFNEALGDSVTGGILRGFTTTLSKPAPALSRFAV
jgi:hypothetical protein